MRDGAPSAEPAYENRMVAVTSMVVAFVAFDRLAVGFLAPYLVEEFSLTNFQVGALYAAQALAAAVGGYVAGLAADARGWRKRIIVPFLGLLSLLAVVSAAARSFVLLVVARFVMGALEGPVAALTQSMVSLQSSAHRRGLNMGVLTFCMFLVSQMLAPIVLTNLADRWGWRAGFLAPAVPMLILALAAAFVLVTATRPRAPAGGEASAPATPLQRRNVVLCVLMSMAFMCWLVVHGTFLPLYLVKVRGMAPTEMGLIMSLLGGAGCAGGLLYPALSDRIGRKPTLLIAMGCATLVPVAILGVHGSTVGLVTLLALGWMSVGALPIYTVIVPGESVPPERAATVIALIMGAGELVGGVAGPLVAGLVADLFGLVTPFWFTAVAAILCAGLALALTETGRVGARPARNSSRGLSRR